MMELRADSRLAPSQWETPLQSNVVSHWLGANLESALELITKPPVDETLYFLFDLYVNL